MRCLLSISLLALLVSLSLVSSTTAVYPVDDLNDDISDVTLQADQLQQSGIPLVINEFVASNNSSALDPQDQYDDWIEIYNFGADAIDLDGMHLTDNLSVPDKWRIHSDTRGATVIPPGGFLVIWADNDTADEGLHANFRLSAGGEEIGLFDTDGSTLIDSVVFLDQTTDISYGRFPDANDVWRFIAEPTPGEENTGGYLGFVDEPKFSREHGFYNTPFSVTLATETKGAVIYYTLDGSEPYDTNGRGRGPSGMLYTEPILITTTTNLRAKAIKPGWKLSNVRTKNYVFLEPDIQNFSSNLPIAVIDTFGKGVGQTTETQTLAFAGFIDNTARGRARPTNTPDFMGKAGLNIRGKSSEGFAKKQYHLETLDENNTDKDVSILGFPAESDWVLSAPYSDKSLMRNFLTYKWSNNMGQYAVRTRYIELFLNTNGGGISMGDYVGVYILMEKIKVGKNRVNISKLEPSDNTEPDISGGYIVKKDKLDTGDLTFNTSRGLSLIHLEPDKEEITQEQKDWIKGYIDEFEAVLYGPNFTDPIDGYAKYIDVDSFINIHILVELTKNIDGFRLSTYMFKDRGGKLNMGPAWDYNLSLGNADYLEGWIPTGWYYPLISAGDYPWWRRLFEDPEFQSRYADRWFVLRQSLFDTGMLLQDIDDVVDLLGEAQVRNFDRWKILGTYVWPNWFIAQTYQEEIDWMKGWLQDRVTWMDTQIAAEFATAPPLFSRQGGRVNQGFNLTMSASFGTIYYTLDGTDPRLTVIEPGETISTTLVGESDNKRAFVPMDPVSDNWKGGGPFDDSAWLESLAGPGGIGFERGVGYENLISLDIGGLMARKNSTCYIRIPFSFDSGPANFDFMTLNIRYDDGFIAYINGIEVARRNFTGTPQWNSGADVAHSDSEAVNFESINISAFLETLQTNNNILAIQGLNSSTVDSDFLISAELIAEENIPSQSGSSLPNVFQYTEPVTLDHSAHIKACIFKGDTWSSLNEAIFAVDPLAENLRVTEIMYNPFNPNTEYIELKNIGAVTINLNLAKFSNGIDFTFPNIELAPGEYVLVVQDIDAFEIRYGTTLNIAGQYTGSLNNAGERIKLEDAIGQTILDFEYKDRWRSIADGHGFSLTIIDPANTDPYDWNEKDSWRASAYLSGSPGEDDSGIVPDFGAVVINEVLAHSHADAADWIELHNTTGTAIDIGGWFLSDSSSDLMKYQIDPGTIIAPDGYIVFYEDQHFRNIAAPGAYQTFSLSENGERLYLSSAENGLLTGYRNVEDFGGSETGVSFGRYYKSSTGNYNFVPMSENTPGSANAYPKVGPIVINEIMYNPSWPDGGSYTNDQYEYIELLNISSEPVSLYNFEKAQPWKFTDGIEFIFPADVPVTIPAGGYLLVVKDPEAFSWRYPMVPVEKILGPYSGTLNNTGERLELSMPGDVDESGTLYDIRVDRISYSDGSHPENSPDGVDHWPTIPDDGLVSLSRISPQNYGNDPANWTSSSPSPGTVNP
ncbi:MAG: CotH kinase family protein [Sedimentisphaerales bacterium]|nr:CotH kinase family protein [Sedimentisphaerales bacterium]